MQHLDRYILQEQSLDTLSRNQIEAAIIYIDTHLKDEADSHQVIRYCALKVELINRIMALDKNNHLLIY
ncbi:hypothetical protein [Adhaeribacter radiodurans]|uniref:Uncharacterized protein n=1 Tax=Adhaeribacter radiodurans TaxID=2745197 RepID=A0A7L7L8C9_9BACT|nr:hypothetical protein [Adhaeribacter radiodurans]QMU29067.1 hypothetical protein HUW48_13905 [Adhaeribacter radiodurans]